MALLWESKYIILKKRCDQFKQFVCSLGNSATGLETAIQKLNVVQFKSIQWRRNKGGPRVFPVACVQITFSASSNQVPHSAFVNNLFDLKIC